MNDKPETTEEFLARGGKVAQIPAGTSTETADVRKRAALQQLRSPRDDKPRSLDTITYNSRRSTSGKSGH